MTWSEDIDEIIFHIKDKLPPDHELQSHDLYPGIKWSKRLIFIVTDDTTGNYLLMDFEKMRRWKKTKHKVPFIKFFKDMREVVDMINHDHALECDKYK